VRGRPAASALSCKHWRSQRKRVWYVLYSSKGIHYASKHSTRQASSACLVLQAAMHSG
jgi:hypothetical protein